MITVVLDLDIVLNTLDRTLVVGEIFRSFDTNGGGLMCCLLDACVLKCS